MHSDYDSTIPRHPFVHIVFLQRWTKLKTFCPELDRATVSAPIVSGFSVILFTSDAE